MYVPQAFHIDDPATLHAFMRQYSFATLVTAGLQPFTEPFATHLPLLLDTSRGTHGTLLGHFARSNPHWQLDHARTASVAIFHGPHAYVSPTWYRSAAPAVPTWNYAVVHATGRLSVIDDPAYTADLLQQMAAVYERDRPQPWINPLPPAVTDKLIASVVAFEISIDRLQGKFKLSQNRRHEDQLGAIEGLESAGDPESLALARFARESLDIPAAE